MNRILKEEITMSYLRFYTLFYGWDYSSYIQYKFTQPPEFPLPYLKPETKDRSFETNYYSGYNFPNQSGVKNDNKPKHEELPDLTGFWCVPTSSKERVVPSNKPNYNIVLSTLAPNCERVIREIINEDDSDRYENASSSKYSSPSRECSVSSNQFVFDVKDGVSTVDLTEKWWNKYHGV